MGQIVTEGPSEMGQIFTGGLCCIWSAKKIIAIFNPIFTEGPS